ncbi:MAG TPA: siphovirus Gp157 family protein [Longimicrobiaceae bacterium]|nr:siphovirus Gp157 family protein [Longimicrobiaceae bacterium]
MSQTLITIEQDLDALDALLAELGGEISEEEAEAAIDAWFSELGEARDAKLDGYARRIQALDIAASAKKEEIARLAAGRKRDETNADWMKRRLLDYVQRRGAEIKGKTTRQIETTLFRFVETLNGGKRALTYLVPPSALPETIRTDVLTIRVTAGHDVAHAAVAAALKSAALDGVEFTLEREAKANEDEVRTALERGEEARAARDEAAEPHSDEDIFRYARLEPRGVRLAIR